jgi:EpsI family protein
MKPLHAAFLCSGILTAAAVAYHGLLLSGRAEGRGRQTPLAMPLDKVPMRLGAWRGTDIPLSDEVVRVAGVTTYLNRRYAAPRRGPCHLYVAYYAHVMDRVPHGPTVCMPYHGWQLSGEETVTLPIQGGGFDGLQVQKVVYEKDFSRLAVLYWHAANGRQLIGKRGMYADSAWTRFKSLFGFGGGYLVQVSVSASVAGSQDEAFQRVEQFFRESFPVIARHFPDAENSSEASDHAQTE